MSYGGIKITLSRLISVTSVDMAKAAGVCGIGKHIGASRELESCWETLVKTDGSLYI